MVNKVSDALKSISAELNESVYFEIASNVSFFKTVVLPFDSTETLFQCIFVSTIAPCALSYS